MQKFFVPRADRRLGNKYELIECLGDGTYGWVWAAQRLQDDAVVALKIPKDQGGENDRLAEGHALLDKPSHPNVVTINWMGRVPPDRQWYVIEMEYFPGSTLAQLVEDRENSYVQSFRATLETYSCVLNGVRHLHSLGIAHGDIKPHNILVSTEGVKVTDFGCSVRPDEMYARTRENGGTILYSAPERLEFFDTGYGAPDLFRADMYSLGVLLYYLMTCRTPHETFSQAARSVPFPKPAEINSAVSPVLESFVLRCLALAPQERWASLDEMVAEFERSRRAQLDHSPRSLVSTPPVAAQDWSSQAMGYLERREYAAAQRVAQLEFEATGDPNAFLMMVTGGYKAERYFDCAKALQEHDDLLHAAGPHGRQLQLLGIDTFLQTRDYRQARVLAERVLKVDPENLQVLLRKASVLGLEAKYEEARDTLLQLNQLCPDSPAVLKRLVLVMEQLRDTGKAQAFLKAYQRVHPEDEWAQRKMAAMTALGCA
jgi:eukaryotic-like serine/threonine-protein kinase